jgi:hypothetical protein
MKDEGRRMKARLSEQHFHPPRFHPSSLILPPCFCGMV